MTRLPRGPLSCRRSRAAAASRRAGLFVVLCLATACQRSSSRSPDGGGDDPVDMTMMFVDPPDQSGIGACGSGNPCPKGQTCSMGRCMVDFGPCTTDDDCQNDTYCECTGGGGGDAGPCVDGQCLPWGSTEHGVYDPACVNQAFAATDFKAPVVKCKWTGSTHVIMTPLVVDLTRDGVPEILFATTVDNPNHLVAIKSKDCSELWNVITDIIDGSQLAVADLDGDKVPEIVAVGKGNVVEVFDNQGARVATSPMPFPSTASLQGAGPAIANLDGQGPPEIVVAGQALRYRKGQPQLEVLWTRPVPESTWGALTAIADLDADGRPEVIPGAIVLDGMTGNDKTPAALADLQYKGAFPAVGDFNRDGSPDIVLVQSVKGNQSVAVFDYRNKKVLFGPYTVAGGGWGGPPTVADFDGDGVPDFGLTSSSNYYTYALKCGRPNPPKDCKGPDPGVLWEKTTHDSTSGATGSTVFDFNGDGKGKVVYRDECWLRVYNGPDGKVLFAANITSGTLLELPVVADVDNDGHADIVVASDVNGAPLCPNMAEADTGTPWTGATQGVFIFRDPQSRWAPSRPLWNQHTYHITNINDDLTVPLKELPSWKTWNNYRQNVESHGKSGPIADFTGAVFTGVDPGGANCAEVWTLRANICNRGTGMVDAGVPGTFYASDPREGAAVPICTGVTSDPLGPGTCVPVACEWMNPRPGAIDLWFRAADDGTGKQLPPECKEGNNMLILPQAQCGKIG